MDIFKTPRDAAVAAQRNPVLWPGTDERFTGYGVMGLPFRRGTLSGDAAHSRVIDRPRVQNGLALRARRHVDLHHR